jgi:hypothetical protein
LQSGWPLHVSPAVPLEIVQCQRIAKSVWNNRVTTILVVHDPGLRDAPLP